MIARLLFVVSMLMSASAMAAPLRVYAAASLTGAMTEAAAAFAATGRPRPVLVFQASAPLARQIIAGAPAGVFVSADTRWMAAVEDAGLLVPGSRRVIARNRLVLIVPGVRPRTAKLEKGFDLARFVGAEGRWTTGDPASVPLGGYAKAALASLGAWDAAVPRLVRAENARAALAYVERGDVAAGVVYATDARASRRVRVAGVFAADSHPPIVYPAALVKSGADAEARAFLGFLSGPQGQAILRAQGFAG